MSLRISYKPFRIKMVEQDVSRKQLVEEVGLNKNTVGKLYKDVEVSLSTILLLCQYFDCRIEDVVEFVPNYVRNERGLIELSPTELGQRIIDKMKRDEA